MGEATYYLKATFATEEEATEAFPKIKEFLAQGEEAGDWWQAHRKDPSTDEFFKTFKINFPLVYEYLQVTGYRGDHNNGLAGRLDFVDPDADDEWVKPEYRQDGKKYRQDGKNILYSAEVWHFANWDLFVEFLQMRFGAVSVNWLSDEYDEPDYFSKL